MADASGRPKWLLTTPEGRLLAARAAASVPAERVARVIVVILREAEELYHCSEAMRRAFDGAVECCILDERTEGPAHTVRETIARLGLDGPVCIKDSDSFFTIGEMPTRSFLAVTDARRVAALSAPGRKSYVRLNEQCMVCEVVEQSVLSNFISVGLYGFEDPAVFTACFDRVAETVGHRRLYVSHVVMQALSLPHMFEPCFVEDWVDIGTRSDWTAYCQRFATAVLDIDGVVFRNQSRFFAPFWGSPVEPIAPNVAHLRVLQAQGVQFVFMTARPECYRAATEAALRSVGLHIHALVMGCNHGTRFLVNDYGTSNLYPSAVAVNMRRNSDELQNLLLADLPTREQDL